MNWKQIYAEKKANQKRIKTLVPEMQNKAGIYVWYRPVYKFYAGQSVSLVDRSVNHIMQYDHLGLSIKKHGLYDPIKNPKGWRLAYKYCDKSELDAKERETISSWAEDNLPYNITSGGQDAGKYDINERKSNKGYRQGVAYGYKKAIRDIKTYFEKYLDYSIKPASNKIKERKLNEFKELLEKENEENNN